MQSRSVFLIAFLWWLVAGAILGALYPVLLTVTDALLASGTSEMFERPLWRTVVDGSVYGMAYGVVGALVNAGLSSALSSHRHALAILTRLVAGQWTIVVAWLMPEASEHVGERAGVTITLAAVAWAIAPVVLGRYHGKPKEDQQPKDARVPSFRPVHMLTSTPHSSDVDSFVRSALRSHGRGNALFTLSSTATLDTSPATTEVLVDAGGTGHALNLAIERWSDELADRADELSGFTVTDDRSLAIAPAGLSASAVVSEGVGLVQTVSGADTVRIQFDGFGH